MDPFVSALEDLAHALAAGENPDQAVADIAEEHGLAPHALRNRAVRAFGPLETYQERQASSKKERERSAIRSDPVLAAATFLAKVSSLSPKLPPEDWDAEVKRLAAEFGVDPAEHRSAIDRVRRRY
jgi:hypothetical protein